MLFTSQGVTYQVDCQMCDNPDCPRHEADFDFTECDADGRLRSSGLRFSVEVDLSTGQAVNPPPASSLAAPVLSDFLVHGREHWFDMLLEEQDDRRRLAHATIDPQDVEAGVLTSWAELAFGEKSILRGGRRVSFVVEHEGVKYYVEDFHCPQPTCACQDIRLHVLGPVNGPSKPNLASLFDGFITLRGKISVTEITDPHITPRLAKDILSSFRHQPHSLKDLREHWRTVKEIATRSQAQQPAVRHAMTVPPISSTAKVVSPTDQQPIQGSLAAPSAAKATNARVGRNDPCPCGSGKKYKKCCL
ncbi:MAG TPA: SEC-C metal-binding domain-containing protein [Candidatus Xenobia bacterium]|jgi:hypothetical protein